MASIRSRFSDEDLEEIRAATREVERATAAEVVCVIVQKCDGYESSLWKAVAMGAIGGTVAAGLWITGIGTWGPVLPWVLLPSILGAAVALLIAWIFEPVQRALVPAATLEHRADRRAALAFLEEDLTHTRDRTGLLLFIALFEHRIRIRCDSGISERISEATWQPIVDDLSAELGRDRKGRAIAAAVRACGEVLKAHGIARRPQDENELSDEPRLSDV